MPVSDYRNSLGYIALQLKAAQQQRDQQAKFQADQFDRQAAQQDKQMSVQSIDSAFKNYNAGEDRKLQLAGLMSRTAENGDLRKQLAEMKDSTQRRGQDLTNEDRDLSRGQQKDLGDRRLQLQGGKFEYQKTRDPQEDQLKRDIATGKNLVTLSGQQNQVTGKTRNEVVERDEHGVPTKIAPAASKPGFIETPKAQADDVYKDVRNDRQALVDSREALKGLESGDKSDFGIRGSRFGITLPLVGRVNPNTIQDFFGQQATGEGKTNTPEQKATKRRALIEQGYGRQVANTIRYLSGLAASEPEARRIFAQFGVKPDDKGNIDIFGTDLDVLKAAMGEANRYIEERAGRNIQEAEQGGIQVGPAQSPTPSNPTSGNPGDVVPQEDPVRAKRKAKVIKLMRTGMDQDSATAQVIAEGG